MLYLINNTQTTECFIHTFEKPSDAIGWVMNTLDQSLPWTISPFDYKAVFTTKELNLIEELLLTQDNETARRLLDKLS